MGKENSHDSSYPPPHTPDTSSLASSLGIDAQERRRIIMMIEGVLHRGSKGQFLKMLGYQGIPLIALIIMCCILLSQMVQLSSSAKLLQRVARRNDRIGELVVSMQIERGLSAAFLSSDITLLNVFVELQEARRRTDTAFTSIQVGFLRALGFPPTRAPFALSIDIFQYFSCLVASAVRLGLSYNSAAISTSQALCSHP